jgi:DNA-binding CsgD family transcriptional regulator
MRLLASCAFPELMSRDPAGWDIAEDRRTVSAPASRQLRAAAALSAVLTGERGGAAADVAEQVLQAARPDSTSLGWVVAALAALIYDDRPDLAAQWCDPLLEEAENGRAPVVHAVLAATRAMISLRQGEPAAAERHARFALSRISPVSWGVGIGVPISVMVQAATAMGRYEDAAAHLSIAVPEAMFRTPCGLHYRRAYGRYHLATGSPHAALNDFQACGELMGRWGFDVPGLIPWRTEAAQALIELGDSGRAARLLDEQLALARPGTRTRAAALRVKAMIAQLGDRATLLREAVDVLRECGDGHELVLALTDLSHVQETEGDHEEATASARAARRLARRSGMRPLIAEGSDDTSPTPAASGLASDLTEAELKVATLAAQGNTNQQIADKLFVTVSTVEQHLTRVYRKLRVDRRSELRQRLGGPSGDPTDRDLPAYATRAR